MSPRVSPKLLTMGFADGDVGVFEVVGNDVLVATTTHGRVWYPGPNRPCGEAATVRLACGYTHHNFKNLVGVRYTDLRALARVWQLAREPPMPFLVTYLMLDNLGRSTPVYKDIRRPDPLTGVAFPQFVGFTPGDRAALAAEYADALGESALLGADRPGGTDGDRRGHSAEVLARRGQPAGAKP